MTRSKSFPKAADSRPTLGGRKVHRIVFVTGKGGVGKSAVAAATALQFARAGKTVLLVELGSRSFYGPLLGLPVGADTVRWTSRIGIARWDVESSLREYVAHYLVFKAAADWVLNYTVMKALMAAAPSLAELAILGKLTGPMRHGWYQRDVDVVVVDAYSTGQFMALLRAPRGLSQTVASGPMHRHTVAMTALLSEPAICEYRLVTLAEEMPTAEACEMARDVRAETGIAPRIYCNRLIDLPPHLPAWPLDDPAAPFVQHMARVAARQRESLAALQALSDERDGPVRRLPLIPVTDARRLLEALADALDAEPGAAR
jgi:anion-transporting  ArsA/GET3 family ATPase